MKTFATCFPHGSTHHTTFLEQWVCICYTIGNGSDHSHLLRPSFLFPQIPPAAATLEGAQPDRLPNHRVTPQPARGTCRRGHCQAAAVLGAGGCGLGPGEVFWAQGGDTGKPVPRGVRMASHRRGHHSGWKMKWEPNAKRREFDSWPPSGHPGPGTGLAPNSGTTRTVGPRARLPGRGGAHGSLQGFLDTTALPAWSELSGSMAVN